MSRAAYIDERHVMLHILLKPDGWSAEVVRDVRQKAAAELERLWRVEQAARGIADDLSNITKVPA